MELYQLVTKFIEIKLSVKDDGHTFGYKCMTMMLGCSLYFSINFLREHLRAGAATDRASDSSRVPSDSGGLDLPSREQDHPQRPESWKHSSVFGRGSQTG